MTKQSVNLGKSVNSLKIKNGSLMKTKNIGAVLLIATDYERWPEYRQVAESYPAGTLPIYILMWKTFLKYCSTE